MFDANSDAADESDFAEHCAGDRHHFRFTISPEDAADLANLRGFTRELMNDAQCDLGTRLDWIAVDHWNTDNPHIHVLMRGRADNGEDLVISREYMSHGFRQRASDRATPAHPLHKHWPDQADARQERAIRIAICGERHVQPLLP